MHKELGNQLITYIGMMNEKFWKTSQPKGFLKKVGNKYITDQMGKSFKLKRAYAKLMDKNLMYKGTDLMGRSLKKRVLMPN